MSGALAPSGISGSLGSTIENGGGERVRQLWHFASKGRAAAKRFRVHPTRWHEPRHRFASISNRYFVTFSNLVDQGGQVLPSLAYSCFFHGRIVLHVAQSCKFWRFANKSRA